MAKEKDKKDGEEMQKGRCADFAVSYYVKFEPIGGNTIHFSYGLLIENNSVKVIDMHQKISEL